jgi:hypothetical protein
MQLSQQKGEPILVQIADNLSVQLHPIPQHEFLMSTKQVAEAYGVSVKAIGGQKQRNEFVEGTHFFIHDELQNVVLRGRETVSKVKRLYFTKRGVVRMGFFLTGQRAELVRTWAENALIEKLEGVPVPSGQNARVESKSKLPAAKPTPQYDRELLDIIIAMDDSKTRLKLYGKLKKGGLL